jgi:hypothetical protein
MADKVKSAGPTVALHCCALGVRKRFGGGKSPSGGKMQEF